MDNDVEVYFKIESRYVSVKELNGRLLCVEAENYTLVSENIMLRESLLTLSKELASTLKQLKTKNK